MTDSLGFRLKLDVIARSTNTSVQPEMDATRPHGVTNHHGRRYIPDSQINGDDDFNRVMDNIRATMDEAARVVMTCQPHRLVLGMSSETFWDGVEGSKTLSPHARDIRRNPGQHGSRSGSRGARQVWQHPEDCRDHAICASRRRASSPLLRGVCSWVQRSAVATLKGIRCSQTSDVNST